jgi:hypothetical protein
MTRQVHLLFQLRRPVFALVDGNPIYGHVTSYAGLEVTLRRHTGSTIAPVSSGEEVPPLVVFLLYKSPLLRRIATPNAITRAHTRILDRLLGGNGSAATRQIRELLIGIVPVASQPRPVDRITWEHPSTGHHISCTVRHVIDFGFYCDGNRENPGDSLGNHYWEDPEATAVEKCLPDPRPAVEMRALQHKSLAASSLQPYRITCNQWPRAHPSGVAIAIKPPLAISTPGSLRRLLLGGRPSLRKRFRRHRSVQA